LAVSFKKMNEFIKQTFVGNGIQVLWNLDAKWRRHALRAECAAIFFILPVALFWFRHVLAFKLLPVAILLALICMVCLLADKTFDFSVLWNIRNFRRHITEVMVAFLCIGVFLTAFTYFAYEHRFLVFPINQPNACLIFILIYPLLSALPQEIIFKSFFFHRYGSIFPGAAALILFNGISFGLFHLWYANVIAPLFSVAAGMLLAYRYVKTRSLIIVTIEHSLLGIFLYIIGLGWFFYSGSIR
jgi:uncharacterized protein